MPGDGGPFTRRTTGGRDQPGSIGSAGIQSEMGALPPNSKPMNEAPIQGDKPKARKSPPEIKDQWVIRFLEHLATDRGASIYTQRNYRQALGEFFEWHE